MRYDILRNTTFIAKIRPDSGSVLSRQIMGENVVKMTFTLSNHIEFRIGDVVTVYGNLYSLNKLPDVTEISSIEFRYSMQFEAVSYDLAKIQCLFFGTADFSLMGNLQTFADLILSNANRLSSGWTLGTIDVTEYKNLTFAGENCLQVLSRLAEQFETEFWVDSKVIHITKREVSSGLTFQYGQGKGLYELSRVNTNDNIVTRLYVYGSTKNLAGTYRNGSDKLLMPVATGAYLSRNTATYGIIEASKIFEDIYPRRTGVVSAIGTVTEVFDSGLDFDINAQLIPGTTAKITFNTGQLAGYTFEISSYNHTTKKIIFNVSNEEKAIILPNPLIHANFGDTYVLTDIIMPGTYITAAETALQVVGQDYLNKNSDPRVNYNVVCDPIHFRRQNISVQLGNTVHILDVPLAVNKTIRVIGIVRSLEDAFSYELSLAEAVSISSYIRAISAAEKVDKELLAIAKNTKKATGLITQAQQTADGAKAITDYFAITLDAPNAIVAAGTVLVGTGALNNAGLTGVVETNPNTALPNANGFGSGSVRFWAGQTYANRGAAPFRVQNDGKLFASNAVISGQITAVSGVIGGFTISNNGLINSNGSAYVAVKNVVGAGAIGASIGAGIASTFWGNPVDVAGQFTNTLFSGANNIALSLDAANGGNNYALNILRGHILLEYPSTIVLKDSGGVPREGLEDSFTMGGFIFKFTRGILTSRI